MRFKKNADNLGKLVLNPKMRITSFKIDYANNNENENKDNNIINSIKNGISNIIEVAKVDSLKLKTKVYLHSLIIA